MAAGNTIRFQHCQRMGIEDEFIKFWREGVPLHGHEDAPRYDLTDYPSVKEHPVEAASELDRPKLARFIGTLKAKYLPTYALGQLCSS